MHRKLFSSFNARPVEAEHVGRSFIYSSTFERLASRNHSMIIGPRGSGKTTYFKMLTIPALRAWKNRQRNHVMSLIDYKAVYVPTDFSWFPDFRHPVGLTVDSVTDEILSYARFRSSVLRALVSTLVDALSIDVNKEPHLRQLAVQLEPDEARTVFNKIAEAWSLESRFEGPDGVIDAINRRNRDIQRLLAIAYYNPEEVRSRVLELDFLHDRIFDDLSAFADTIEAVSGRRHSWAMCFDEVEIAPAKIREEIWNSLRSFDQRFIIKMSASPYDEAFWQSKRPNSPMSDNDFDEIWLLQDRQDVEEFSRKMFSGMCADLGIPPERQKGLLGSSYYDDSFDLDLSVPNNSSLAASDGATIGNVRKDGFYVRRFQSLSAKDDTFKTFLSRNDIDVDRIRELTGNRRAFVRKFISSVVIRDAYLRSSWSSSSVRLASKKAIDQFYTGETTIFRICEGNPRWLLVVLRPMLMNFLSSPNARSNVISRDLQARSLEDGVTTLLSILSTVGSDKAPSGKQQTLLGLIERIGDFFFDEVLGREFVPEPNLTFRVDHAVDEPTLKLIGAAVNQGALVVVPDKRNPRSVEIADARTLRSQRLRLSYYLAARYRLPLVLGRTVDLSTILSQKRASATERQIMLDLFGEKP